MFSGRAYLMPGVDFAWDSCRSRDRDQRNCRATVNAIPFLGTLIALAILSLLFFWVAENIEPLTVIKLGQSAALKLFLLGITHVLDDVVFQPFVLGSAVNIHPLVVVVAIISGSLIMGLWVHGLPSRQS